MMDLRGQWARYIACTSLDPMLHSLDSQEALRDMSLALSRRPPDTDTRERGLACSLLISDLSDGSVAIHPDWSL